MDITDPKRIEPTIRQMLFADKLDLTKAINVDPNRLDEMAAAFTCDLKTAACICDTVRSHDRRAGDHPTRVYIKRAVAWVKLPGGAVLTKVVGGKVFLNPEVFGDAAGKPEVRPPAAAIFRKG